MYPCGSLKAGQKQTQVSTEVSLCLSSGRYTFSRSDPGPHGVGYEDDDTWLFLHQSAVHRAGIQRTDWQTRQSPTAAVRHYKTTAAMDREAGKALVTFFQFIEILTYSGRKKWKKKHLQRGVLGQHRQVFSVFTRYRVYFEGLWLCRLFTCRKSYITHKGTGDNQKGMTWDL